MADPTDKNAYWQFDAECPTTFVGCQIVRAGPVRCVAHWCAGVVCGLFVSSRSDVRVCRPCAPVLLSANPQSTFPGRVNTFTVQTSVDGERWVALPGTFGDSMQKDRQFVQFPPTTSRYIRICPKTWRTCCAMKIDLFAQPDWRTHGKPEEGPCGLRWRVFCRSLDLSAFCVADIGSMPPRLTNLDVAVSLLDAMAASPLATHMRQLFLASSSGFWKDVCAPVCLEASCDTLVQSTNLLKLCAQLRQVVQADRVSSPSTARLSSPASDHAAGTGAGAGVGAGAGASASAGTQASSGDGVGAAGAVSKLQQEHVTSIVEHTCFFAYASLATVQRQGLSLQDVFGADDTTPAGVDQVVSATNDLVECLVPLSRSPHASDVVHKCLLAAAREPSTRVKLMLDLARAWSDEDMGAVGTTQTSEGATITDTFEQLLSTFHSPQQTTVRRGVGLQCCLPSGCNALVFLFCNSRDGLLLCACDIRNWLRSLSRHHSTLPVSAQRCQVHLQRRQVMYPQ